MSKRQEFYDALFSSGKLVLPDGEEEKKKAAQQLFGAIMVACVDVDIEAAIDLLDRSKQENPPAEAHKWRELRESLSSLTDEQRASVIKLVKKIASGVLYSQCVKIDNFPGMHVEIRLVPHDDSSEEYHNEDFILVAAPTEDEMMHRYYQWVKKFSDYIEN